MFCNCLNAKDSTLNNLKVKPPFVMKMKFLTLAPLEPNSDVVLITTTEFISALLQLASSFIVSTTLAATLEFVAWTRKKLVYVSRSSNFQEADPYDICKRFAGITIICS